MVAFAASDLDAPFIAVNRIAVRDDYRDRFEELFATRAQAIDELPGFKRMSVLRPAREDEPYLVMSEWESESSFQAWLKSPEFLEGHRRGFADVAAAKAKGEEPPMKSDFLTYEVVSR